MRLLMVTAAALALGACCHTAKPAPEAPVAPATEEETAVEPSEWQPPVMPTAEEAAKAAADAQAAAEAGVVYAGYDKKGGEVALKLIEAAEVGDAGANPEGRRGVGIQFSLDCLRFSGFDENHGRFLGGVRNRIAHRE